jgi:hypothetical protein
MTGSSLAPIIIPIVVTLSLAIWLIMVYYADGHPCWRRRDQARHPRSTGSQPVSVTPVVDPDFPIK